MASAVDKRAIAIELTETEIGAFADRSRSLGVSRHLLMVAALRLGLELLAREPEKLNVFDLRARRHQSP